MARRSIWLGLISLLVVAVTGGWKVDRAATETQSQSKTANRLLTAKLVAVVSMPEGMDRWLIEDLRHWGRYRVTADPEGADLVVRGYNPQKEPQFKLHRGIPQPKREKHEPPPVLSVSVIDWVNNEAVWQADILNRKPKQGDDGPAGPQTQINARGLKPQELARELTARLQQYVAELERTERSK
jgi:hypothetical protein